MLSKEEIIHEVFKKVMFEINELFEEQTDIYDDYDDDDDFIPEEKITVDLLEDRIKNAITVAIEEMVENGELSVD